MKIGLLSDTHGYLEDKIFTYFEKVDEIWHAGDIGSLKLLQSLSDFKPTVAVYGNVDGRELRAACEEYACFEREGFNILLTHIAGKPPAYNQAVRSYIKKYQPRLLVCGHSHILKVMPDKAHNLLYLNPGAAGRHGFHKKKTLLRFDLKNGDISNLEVIELGKRTD